jgi:chromosome segregation ATPase
MRVLIFAFLAVVGLGLKAQKNPIQKVIELIEELRDKTIADGKAEELVYNRMACWCETTTHGKAAEIKKCQEDLSSLSQDINSNKGSVAQLASDIHDLMTDISLNEAKQYMETTKRERQNADYMQNKAELTNAIVALDKALQMLSGVDHLALIQGKFKLSTSQMTAVRAVKPAVLAAIQRLPTDNKIPVHKLSALERLGQRFNNKYSPFEPTITQILKDLLESFKATQETETSNEADCQKSYEEIMESKANELATKKQMLADKEEAKAKQNKDEAANQAQWQITADQLEAANKVFVAAKASCTRLANMWDERKKLREEELKGIKEALATLTSDENRALIGKAAADGPGKLDFVQVKMVGSSSQTAHKAYMALRKTATKAHSVQIATVAASLMERMQSGKNDEWKDDILKEIDDILKTLSEDQERDTMTYDNCKEEEHQLHLEIDNRTGEIKRFNWKIGVLERKIEDLQEKITDAAENVESILEMQRKLKAERDSENTEYESEKSDDEAAIGVLETAIGQLSKFYEKQGVDLGKLNEADGKFLQMSDKADDIFLQTSKKTMLSKEPVFKKTDHEVVDGMNDFEFSDKGSRGQQSKGIIGLLTVIKEDLASDIEKATAMEDDAQAEYDKIKKDTDDELSDLRDKIDDYKDEKSDKEGDVEDNEQWKETEEGDLANAKDEMKTMMEAGDEGKDISFPCEFMMAQYHNRRVQREAETEGLKQAVAFLEGMQ